MKKLLLSLVLISCSLLAMKDSSAPVSTATQSTPSVAKEKSSAIKSGEVKILKKSELLAAITSAYTAAFNKKPIYKNQIADGSVKLLTALEQNIQNFVTKQATNAFSSDIDPLIKKSWDELKSLQNDLINTSKIIFNSFFRTGQKTVSASDKNLFDKYAVIRINAQKIMDALKKESYTLSGKRETREILLQLANAIIASSNQAFEDSYEFFPKTPVPDKLEKLTIYNNTLNTILVTIKLSGKSAQEIIIDAQNSRDISIPVAKIDSIAIKPIQKDTNESAQNFDAKTPLLTALNTLKTKEATITVKTANHKYELDSGKKTANPASYFSTELKLRNKTRTKIDMQFVDTLGKTTREIFSCSSTDDYHLVKFKDGTKLANVYILGIPAPENIVSGLQKALNNHSQKIFDIHIADQAKYADLWEYYLNTTP